MRRTLEAETGPVRPRLASSAASSGQLHRASGTPVAAGSWQASAHTSARSAALIRRGRPVRGRSFSPASPRPANLPRHLRTMSSLTPSPAAIAALGQPRAAASTIRARCRSRCAVLAPRPRFFSIFRSLAVSQTGTARNTGIGAPGGIHVRDSPAGRRS